MATMLTAQGRKQRNTITVNRSIHCLPRQLNMSENPGSKTFGQSVKVLSVFILLYCYEGQRLENDYGIQKIKCLCLKRLRLTAFFLFRLLCLLLRGRKSAWSCRWFDHILFDSDRFSSSYYAYTDNQSISLFCRTAFLLNRRYSWVWWDGLRKEDQTTGGSN